MSGAEFDTYARDGILEACLYRCAGCGRPHTPTHRLDMHHRDPRGMGGSVDARLGIPANGVALCGPGGSGGCHGWAHSHPAYSLALGWMIPNGADPLTRPFRTHQGWRWWVRVDDNPARRHAEYLVEWLDVDGAIALLPAGTPDAAAIVRAAEAALERDRPTPNVITLAKPHR